MPLTFRWDDVRMLINESELADAHHPFYGLETGPVTGNVGGSVSYGLGVTAEGDVGFSWDRIGFSGRTGATVGLGAEADIIISINPSAVADGIGDALDYFGW